MSKGLKAFLTVLFLLALGAFFFYSFLVLKTWHTKARYLDCAIAAQNNQDALAACSKK